MILRQLALRHGRNALAKPATPSWRRALASAVQSSQFQPVTDPASIGLAHPSTEQETVPVRAPAQDSDMAAFAAQYWDSEAYKKKTRSLGGSAIAEYKPHLLVNHPPAPQDITLELLMASQAHLGHATGLWHPGNARYIYGVRDGIHIISLDATASHLRRACKIVEATVLEGGLVLFVGTRSGQERSVVKAAELAGGCHVFDRWIPGSITNRIQILGKCRTKVVDHFDKDVPGYESQLSQACPLKPDLVVVLNPLENHVLLRECNQHNIPTIGVVDTDCNPALVTYPIPANDDSRRCTNVIAGVLGRAAGAGRTTRLAIAAELGQSTYPRRHKLDAIDKGEEGEAVEETAAVAEADLEHSEGEMAEAAPETTDKIDLASVNVTGDYAAMARAASVGAAFEVFNLSDQQDGAAELLQGLDVNSVSKATTTDADPMLERLIAMKRRALGEELSAKDKEVLKAVEKMEVAERAEAEKGRDDLLAELATAKKDVDAQVVQRAVQEGNRVNAEREDRRREKQRQSKDDRASYGPVTKTRKGRAQPSDR